MVLVGEEPPHSRSGLCGRDAISKACGLLITSDYLRLLAAWVRTDPASCLEATVAEGCLNTLPANEAIWREDTSHFLDIVGCLGLWVKTPHRRLDEPGKSEETLSLISASGPASSGATSTGSTRVNGWTQIVSRLKKNNENPVSPQSLCWRCCPRGYSGLTGKIGKVDTLATGFEPRPHLLRWQQDVNNRKHGKDILPIRNRLTHHDMMMCKKALFREPNVSDQATASARRC